MVSSDFSRPSRGSSDTPDDDLTDFLGLLNELKSSGCNLLVVGDAPRDLFTRASRQMLGADDEHRYRVLAVTDASQQSIADRLPDPSESPRPITETTHVLNHAGALRSITAASSANTPTKLAGVSETRIADPELDGFQSALVDAISDFAARRDCPTFTDVRVCVDSLEPLLDFYDDDIVVKRLRVVGNHVRNHDAMAHYVLPKPYESEAVQTLIDDVDAVVELRLAESSDDDRTGEQRWRVPSQNMTMCWTPL